MPALHLRTDGFYFATLRLENDFLTFVLVADQGCLGVLAERSSKRNPMSDELMNEVFVWHHELRKAAAAGSVRDYEEESGFQAFRPDADGCLHVHWQLSARLSGEAAPASARQREALLLPIGERVIFVFKAKEGGGMRQTELHFVPYSDAFPSL